MTQTQFNSSIPQRRHCRLSTVHLAGLSIVTRTHMALRGTAGRQRSSSVLMNALRDPVVLLLSGLMTGNAGYTTNVVNNIVLMAASRSLKSSDDVTLRQVRDMSEYSLYKIIQFSQVITFLQTALFVFKVHHKLLPSHLMIFYQNNEVHHSYTSSILNIKVRIYGILSQRQYDH